MQTRERKNTNTLAYWRRQRNLSQQYIADQLGVTRVAVSFWEHDIGQPTREQMERISEILEKPIGMLFDIG